MNLYSAKEKITTAIKSFKNLTALKISIIAEVFVIILSLIFTIFADKKSLPLVIHGGLIVFLSVSVWVMAELFRRSMKATLYSYTNIALVGSMIFAVIFIIVFTVYFISFIGTDELSVRHIFEAFVNFPRRFSYYAVFIIIAVCLLLGISNISLMRHEGYRVKNALSLVIACFYIGGTVMVYIISFAFEKYVLVPLGLSENPIFMTVSTVISLFLLLMLCYFECIFAGSLIMGWLAVRKKPSYNKDFIIILGCSIDKKGGLLPLLKGRVNRAVKFAWEQEIATGKSAKYVPSGGQGADEVMSEGSAMELYLLTRGAEDYEVFPEKKSTDTLENLRFSKKIIDELMPDATIAYATTNYHILRSGILAREAGFDAEGISAKTKWYFWPNGFIREFFGILALKKKAHITVAIIIALLCVLVGLIEYFGNFI